MYEVLIAILSGASGNLVADGVKKAIGSVRTLTKSNTSGTQSAVPFDNLLEALPSVADFGESPRFLFRQRILHRISLASAKWRWAVVTHYYHPTEGKALVLPEDWRLNAIAGQFSVADFAARPLPADASLRERSTSRVRTSILQSLEAQIDANIASIRVIESEIDRVAHHLVLPRPVFSSQEARYAWMTLCTEINGVPFLRLPQFTSYCGFKNLWTIKDTPEYGVRSRDEDRANIYSFSSLMELSLVIANIEPWDRIYAATLKRDHPLPHQHALRKLAASVLKEMWKAHIPKRGDSSVRGGG